VVFEAGLTLIRLDAIRVIDHSRVGDYLAVGLGDWQVLELDPTI